MRAYGASVSDRAMKATAYERVHARRRALKKRARRGSTWKVWLSLVGR